MTGPLTDTIAARLDGVYMKRDGFMTDVISGRRLDNRDRWLLRGQMLYQPNDKLSLRIIGDYSKLERGMLRRDLSAGARRDRPRVAADRRRSRRSSARSAGSSTTTRSRAKDVDHARPRLTISRVRDWGMSGELDYDLGGAQLTSITAYRYNKYIRGQDADYNNLDLLYRPSDGGSFNRFRTFSQELRLQGTDLEQRLDWLIGGYYANEKLARRRQSRLRQGLFAFRQLPGRCELRIEPAVDPRVLAPGASPDLLQHARLRRGVRSALVGAVQCRARSRPVHHAANSAANIAALGAFARLTQPGACRRPFRRSTSARHRSATAASPISRSRLAGLASSANVERRRAQRCYRQTSDNWALFTHNIFSITDQLKLTLGAPLHAREEDLDAYLLDNNTLCRCFSGGGACSSCRA